MEYYIEKILSINHWTNELFSFKSTRNNNFKFKNGEFTLVGIFIGDKPLTRAYSIVSSNNENYIEFLSIKALNGELTSKIKFLKKNDNILIGKKSTGTLLIDNLKIGKNLWLICSGTGIAPFISILNSDIYYNYEKIILIHSVKDSDSLVYRYFILNNLFKKKLFLYKNNLFYFSTLTKDKFYNSGRITDIINNKEIFEKLNLNYFFTKEDKFMICGSINMLSDIIYLLNFYNFHESKNNKKGDFVIERAFIN